MKYQSSKSVIGAELQHRVVTAVFLFALSIMLGGCETSSIPEPFIDHAPQSRVLESVPYRLDERSRIIIAVQVNGQGPYDFILDTAASRTLVYEHVRKELGLTFNDQRTTFVHGATISQRRPVLPIAEVRLGALAIKDIQSFSLPDPISVDVIPGGVLGLDFLSLYAIYINISEQRIHFAKSGYVPARASYVTVPIRFRDFDILDYGLPFVPAGIQGRPVEALFDLGSESNIANWAAANSIGVNLQKFLRNQYRFEGVFSDIPITSRARGADISVGQRLWADQLIDIGNLPIFATIGMANKPAMIVSASLLRGEDLIIDFPAKKLFLRATRKQRVGRKGSRCIIRAVEVVSLSCLPTRIE